MYTRSTAYENTDDQKMVELQIADVQQMYKEDGKDIQAEHIQDIVSVNGEKVQDLDYTVDAKDRLEDAFTIIRRGKKRYYCLNLK